MLYAILGFFSLIQAIIGVALMAASTMKFREPVKKRIMIGFIAMLFGIVLLSLSIIIRGVDWINGFVIIYILTIILAWFFICSGDTFFVSLFDFLTCVNIYVSTSYISDTLAFHDRSVNYIIKYIVIRTIIYAVIVTLLFRFVRPRFRKLVDTLGNEWRAATLVPLIFLILQILLLYYPAPFWAWKSNNWNKFIIITVYLLFLAVYYLLYIQASTIVEKYVLEKRQLLIAQQDKLWESELSRQKTAICLASQQRHDMHHHNAVILDMLKDGKLIELEAYMQSYDEALDKSKSTVYCKNPIVNSICNAYAKKAEQAQIKMYFHMVIPEQTGIDSIDLTCIFGNAFENAYEGCLRLPNDKLREINVIAKYMDERLRILIENSCLEDIIFEGELPKTQKKIGGTGIHSMIYTAERYDGTSGFSASNGKFYTNIVLNAVSIDSQI